MPAVGEPESSSTSNLDTDATQPKHFWAVSALTAILVAGSAGISRCFHLGNVTGQYTGGSIAESSTEPRDLPADIRAALTIMIDNAQQEILEDGMHNDITKSLPRLVARDFQTVIPALVSLIARSSTPPVVAAEILKELGGIVNTASHQHRRWVLERALGSKSAFARDGAGLGLARLGDTASLPSLYHAIAIEPHPQIKWDLQLVADELTTVGNGVPAQANY